MAPAPCPHGEPDMGACLVCFAAIDAIARRHFERQFPHARVADWEWLPAAAKRQWLTQAAEDWTLGHQAAAGVTR